MKKRLIIMILSVVLVLSSILTIFAYSNIKYNNNKLIYSNMIDKKTQNSVKEILKENKINDFAKIINNKMFAKTLMISGEPGILKKKTRKYSRLLLIK